MKKFYKFLMPLVAIVAMVLPVNVMAQSLTVANGTATNTYVPIYGYYCDDDQHNQIVYPASMLAAMTDNYITSLTFYHQQAASSPWGTTVTIKMMEITDSTLTDLVATTGATTVFTGTVNGTSATEMFLLTTPYEYLGGNLLVDITTTASSYSRDYWYGISRTNSSVYVYGDAPLSMIDDGSGDVEDFLPKTTFTYNATGSFCFPPSAFSANVNEATETALFSWTDATSTAWELAYGTLGFDPDLSTDVLSLSTNSYTLDLSTMDSGCYQAYVRADCGSGDYSMWVGPVNFNIGVNIMNMATSGIDTLRTCNAIIYDDGGPSGSYSNNCQSTLIITASQENSVVRISGTSYTESTYDYLTIYEGAGTSGPIIWTDNGIDALTPFGPLMADTITVVFSSDGSVSRDGFEFTVTCEPVPTCVRPENFTIVSVDTSEVTFSWVDTEGSAWAIEYGPSGFDPSDTDNPAVQFEDFSSIPGTVTGLMPGTSYDFYLMSICGTNEGDTSWTLMTSTYTVCGSINTLPYTEDWESFTASYDAPFHPCWTRGNNSGNDAPYVYENQPYSSFDFPTKALFFYGYDDNFRGWTVMPTVGSGFEMNELELSLDAYVGYSGSYYSHNFIVGIIDSNVYIPGMPIDTIGDYAIASYEHKDISFADYEGDGRNIILLAYLDGDYSSMSLAFDNINLHYIPQCDRPDSLTLVAADTASLELSWWASDESSEFFVEWRAGTSGAWSSDAASSTNYTITGLTANTTYSVRVSTVCGSDTSFSVTGTFRTQCAPINVFPWVESFETASFSCWGTYNYNFEPSDDWAIYEYIGHTGGNSIYSTYSLDMPGTNWLVTPAIELGDTMDAAQLSYWVFGQAYDSYYPHYAVKISTTSGIDTTAFTTIFEETRDDSMDPYTYEPVWSKKTFSLGQYAGQTIYIAFVRHANYDDGLYLDDIAIQQVVLPEVAINGTPGPAVGMATSYSAQILGGPTDGLTFAWNSTRATAGNATMTVVDSANITMLYPTTGADTLRLIATNAYGSDTAYLVVSPVSVSYAALPYSTGFEATDDTAWTISNGPNGWYIDTAIAANGSRSLYISSNNGASNIYDNSSQTNSFAYKAFNFATAGQYGISFDWRNQGENSYDDIQVYLVPAGDSNMVGSSADFYAPTSWTSLTNALSGSSAWQNSTIIFNVNAPGIYNLCFRWRNDGSVGTNPAGAIDNIQINIITCPAPTALVIDSTSSSSARFHWNRGAGETAWEVQVGNLAPVVVADTFYTATGLTHATNYNVRVRGICGAGDTSLVLAGSFWTECNAFNVPYYIHFNSSPLNVCWSDVVTSTTPPSTRWSSSANYGYDYIYSQAASVSNPTSDYLISPVINIPTDTAGLRLVLRIAGQAASYYTSSNASYMILVSPTGADSVAAFTDTLYRKDTINSTILDWLRLALNNYAGQSVRFAVRNTSRYNGTVYLYDFAVRYINLPMYYIYGSSSAMTGDTNLYTAEYQEGDTNGMVLSWTSVMAAAGQATILNANTDSMSIVYNTTGIDSVTFIATNAHGADTTAFYVNVMSLNPVTTLPYTTGFETTNADNNYWIIRNGENAWTIGTAAHNEGARALYVSADNGVSNEYNASVATVSYASRAFDIAAAGDYNVSFDWNCNGESNYDYLRAFFVPDAQYNPEVDVYPGGITSAYSFATADITGWTNLGGKLNQSAAWTHEEDSIHIDNPGRYHLVFVWSNDGSVGNNPAAAVDNVEVNNGSASACAAPTVIVSNLDHQSATITAAGVGINYEFNYGTDSVALGNILTDTTGVFNLAGLTPNTQYFYAMRQQCDSNTWSAAAAGSFTTNELPCFTPDSLQVVSTTFSTAELTWQSSGTATTWVLAINGPGNLNRLDTVSTNPYTITGLYADAQYTVAARAICMLGTVESDWSDTLTFTTNACTPVTGVTVSNITASTAMVNWNAIPGASTYRVSYGEPGFYESEALRAEVTTNSYTITGLEAETDYEVYVENKCGEGIYSVVTAADRIGFTTNNEAPTTYTVTVSSNNPAWGSVSGGGTYPAGAQVTITATANDGYRFVEWNDGNTDNPRTFTVTEDVEYIATFEAGAQGIDDVESGMLTLFPNPASSSVTLTVSGFDGEAMVEVVDMNGRTVSTHTTVNSELKIDVSTLAQGAYFVRVTGERQTAVRKLIVR